MRVFIFLWTSPDILKSGHVSAAKVTHLALYLPGLGDGWQVTTCHHHGPEGVRQTHSQRDKEKKTGRATRWWFAVACCLRNLLIFLKSTWQTFLSTLNQFTYMTISFLMGLVETKAVASFSSVIGSVAFTMFWNMVLFLCGEKQVTSHWAAFLQLLRSRLRLAVVLRLALTVAAKRPICSKPTWSKAPDLWRWCRRRTSAAHSQTDASGGCRRCSSSAGDHK